MIEREEKDWGVLVTMQPLSARPMMRIICEVDFPKPGKKSVTRYWFDGAPSEKPLRLTELNVWSAALKQFLDAVKDVSARMVAKKKR